MPGPGRFTRIIAVSRSGKPAARQSTVAPRAFLRTPSRQTARVATATIPYESSNVYRMQTSSGAAPGRRHRILPNIPDISRFKFRGHV